MSFQYLSVLQKCLKIGFISGPPRELAVQCLTYRPGHYTASCICRLVRHLQFQNFWSSSVTKSGIWLLTAQELASGDGGESGPGVWRRTPVQRTTRGESFYRCREGLHAETAQAALAVVLKLVIGGLTSVILIGLSTVNFQFQGRFVLISLRLILGIVAAHVTATVWSSCSSLLPPGEGFSIYKTAHRIWLRILSVALEKELKVLDFAYWLNCYCFVLFDCFSLLLHFLTSLIKRTLWLKFFHRQKAGGGHGGHGPYIGSCSVSVGHDLYLNIHTHRLMHVHIHIIDNLLICLSSGLFYI